VIRKQRIRKPIGILLLLPLLLLGCSASKSKPPEDPVASFKRTVEDFLRIYKQSNLEEVFHIERFEDLVPEGWKKDYSELVSDAYSVDVQKTDSLVSPYIGTLKFDTKMHFSNLQDSEKGARDTQIFADDSDPNVHNHVHTYAYQDGAWVVKSRKQNIHLSSIDDKWTDCKDGE
jgi:hypothetical protein